MDNYTKVMEEKAYEAANDYYPKEILLEAATSFHKFSDSLDYCFKGDKILTNVSTP